MCSTSCATGSASPKAATPNPQPPSSTRPRSKQPKPLGRENRGYDGGKKINGRKRHIAVDTLGLLLGVLVTAASVQDRVAARPLLHWLKTTSGRIQLVWADGGYLGTLLGWATHVLDITVEIIKRNDDTTGFVVLPRRWVVERTMCAARRSVVSPIQPGGTRREVPGSNGLSEAERLRGQEHAREPGDRVQRSGTVCRGDPRDTAKAGLLEA
ncbi:transposase [Amycolatopsis sp. NPDC026612]|uniref:transposase n=1 Tax=Amycolatopsis sp. NPDC026612 TaxID=3155466 RepID=UPI0033F740FD